MGNGGETNGIAIFSIGAGRRSRSKGDSSVALPIERGSLLRVVAERIKRLSLSLQAALGDVGVTIGGSWRVSLKRICSHPTRKNTQSLGGPGMRLNVDSQSTAHRCC